MSVRPCLASPSCLPLSSLPPPLTATSGRSRVVEGQKRKFSLSELPALFNMVHWVCVCVCVKVSVLTGAFKRAGHGSEWEEEEEEGRVGTGRWRGCSWEKEVRQSREVEYRGAMLPPYENVFIWPMTDGRCCQPGSGSHCLTVTEAWNAKFIRPPSCDQLALGGDLWGLWTMLSRRLKLPLAQVSCRLRTCSGGLFSVLLRRRRALFPWTWEEIGGNDAECKFWLPGLASAVNYAAIPAGRRSDWRQRSGSSWGEGLIPCLFMQVCSRSTRFRSFLLYLPLPRELLGHWCEKPPEWTESMLVKPLWAPPGWLTDLITSYTVTILTDV